MTMRRIWYPMIAGVAVLLVAGVSPAVAGPRARVAATLHVIDTTCRWQNDSFGSDEPYLRVNGVRVWSGSNVDDGDREPVEFWIGFDEVVQVELWEDDGGLTGEDDRIATWYVFAGEAGTGVKTVQSPWETRPALYDLRYEVVT